MTDIELNDSLLCAQFFVLVDGAANPGIIRPLLEEAGVEFLNVYEGLPEEALGAASLFLAPASDPEAAWVLELERIDRHSPCLSLVWARVAADQLAMHLRAFLFAQTDDGATLVRFFDPRNTSVVFHIWGPQILDLFMGPIERWMYRGRHQQWQRIENDTVSGARVCRSISIHLEPSDLNDLAAHTEPDEYLTLLIQMGLIDGARSYFERFSEFFPRYERALQWALTDATDRLIFCQYSYRYGFEFDRHPYLAEALEARKKSGKKFDQLIEAVPAYVWEEISRNHSSRNQASNDSIDA